MDLVASTIPGSNGINMRLSGSTVAEYACIPVFTLISYEPEGCAYLLKLEMLMLSGNMNFFGKAMLMRTQFKWYRHAFVFV